MIPTREILIERFWSKVEKTRTCWIWKCHTDKDGYGDFRVYDKKVKVHRFAYEIVKGTIPKGLEIDHLCKNPSCVNPDHLELVTHKENVLRGNTFQSKNAKKTHCSNGHELKGDNLQFTCYKGYIHRKCRTCNNTISLACYYKRKLKGKG